MDIEMRNRDAKQRGNDIAYEEELSRYNKREERFKHNLKKAYNVIVTQYCIKAMWNRIKEQVDYESNIK